jgi:hypothetical protein
MKTSILKAFILDSPKTKFSDEQVLLREFSGRDFSRGDAKAIWSNVLDHKWNISEELGRDVGFKVATLDFMENFYAPMNRSESQDGFSKNVNTVLNNMKNAVRNYFESKGNSLHV